MKNTKIVLIALGLLSALTIQAQEEKKVSGFNHIESVATDGKFLYVADIGKNLTPEAKDGDGSIARLDGNGKIVEQNFAKETLNAPKGLAIDNGILYANDVDRLIAIDLASGNKLYEISFNGVTSYLNDIAVWDKNTLYVSATDKSKLFKVNLADKTFSEVITNVSIAGINGLYCTKKAPKLYVNGLGSDNKPNGVVGYINLNNNEFTQLNPLEGLYDGIFVDDNTLYFSNWVAYEKKGVVFSMKLSNNKLSRVKISELIAGPADFIVFKNQLIIPGMMDGTLLFVPIKKESHYVN